jgi:hypothetical protein
MSTVQHCPVKGVCLAPSQCAQAAGCVLQTAPLILRPLSDWRADPTPFPLRADTKPRAGLPEVFA